MEVDDAEEALVLVLQLDPIAQRAEVVAEVEVAGRLDPREDARHNGGALQISSQLSPTIQPSPIRIEFQTALPIAL